MTTIRHHGKDHAAVLTPRSAVRTATETARTPVSRGARRRRGSILVLVVTLLSILFVVGVAFLASMNFEADIIVAEQRRDRSETGSAALFAGFMDILREGLVSSPGAPFGGGSVVNQPTGTADLPGWHNVAAPIEPYRNSSGAFVYGSFTDLGFAGSGGLRTKPFQGPTMVPSFGFEIETAAPVGQTRTITVGGETVEFVPVDADGDGIADTIQVDAESLGLSKGMVAELSNTVNGRPNGRVGIGLRILAHGGLVNLNESHPRLIQEVFNLRRWPERGETPDPELDNFRHMPTQDLISYSPLMEECLLRRRGLLPPAEIPPSRLHGNPLLTGPGGSGDMAAQLLPVSETISRHRFWMFNALEPLHPGDPDGPLAWPMRVEPFYSLSQDNSGRPYDRRHLVTTVGYDDLLARGGVDEDGVDLLELMREANRRRDDPNECVPPFEYPNYPQTMPLDDDGTGTCDCPTSPSCVFNARKGRLQLSLPWLDERYPEDRVAVDAGLREERDILIHDVFAMLVRNATGPYWDRPKEDDCTSDEDCAPGSFVCDPISRKCLDPWTGRARKLALISRTAASLTANMIDYMDRDDIPTRIPLRSFDFNDLDRVGREVETHIPGITRPQYVYGLERQPFITEVATSAETGAATTWAIELFNPYPDPIDPVPDSSLNPRYWLFITEPDETDPLRNAVRIPIRERIVAADDPAADDPADEGAFTVFWSGNDAFTLGTGPVANGWAYEITTGTQIRFDNGSRIYLVRLARYDGNPEWIVVDQFDVDGPNIAKPKKMTGGSSDPDPNVVYSMQRVVQDLPSSPWTAPVPDEKEIKEQLDTLKLGDWNGRPEKLHPVEIRFANTGSFTKKIDGAADNGVAFPTTGSMLLLMRHANRSMKDFKSGEVEDLAFTTGLNQTTRQDVVREYPPGSGIPVTFPVQLDEADQIDNGRMPVFDRGFKHSIVGVQSAHHVAPNTTETDAPGGVEALPWGQLVFDYFTALPLDSPGPYDQTTVGQAGALPRVDLDGLRVHGRININAAPWTVLRGLPFVPVEKIPLPYRNKIRGMLYPPDLITGIGEFYDGETAFDNQAGFIGDRLAQGIVAYREAREVDPSGSAVTGDYGLADGRGRGWNDANPAFRRGTGFLTVGELANVRRPATGTNRSEWSSNAAYRVDYGNVDIEEDLLQAPQDYVDAVAVLAALGDWVSVRSHVYTVYGVVRGEIDDSITDSDADEEEQLRLEDVASRELRFQETVDRLPTFLGEAAPRRIGDRVLVRYTDIHSD